MGNICDAHSVSRQVIQPEDSGDIRWKDTIVKKHTIRPKPKKLKLLDRNVVKVHTLKKTIKITTNHRRIHKKTEKFVKKYRIEETNDEYTSSNDDSVEIKTQI